MKASDYMTNKQNARGQQNNFIENFIQISKASYISYEKYADKW